MLTIKTTGVEDYLDPEGGGAWVQALIVGGHGVGKTPFAGRWPKPIFAMAEHGTMSIARLNLPYGEIYTDADMDAFINEVRKDCVIKDVSKRKYLTAVLDTVDSYQSRLMQHRVESMGLERFTGWDHWDWLDAKLVKAINALSALPIHLVVNMHYKDTFIGDGDDKQAVKESRLKGDMKMKIFQEFDLIGFMETYYQQVGGERKRKHRIRWWPEPGYEFVRSRAVNDDGVALPQFTPVDFAESDFFAIYNAIAEGAEGLTESKVVTEIQTEAEENAANLPSPDEGAGPVSQPSLPPAQKEKVPTIKELLGRVGNDPEKAQKMLEWEQSRESPRSSFISSLQKIIDEGAAAENATEATSEPEPEAPATAPVTTSNNETAPTEGVTTSNAPSSENGKGTAEVPLVMEEARLNQLDGPKYAVLEHVHSPEGKCLKSAFTKPCPLVPVDPESIQEPVDKGEPEAEPEVTHEEAVANVSEIAEVVEDKPVATPVPEGTKVESGHCGHQPESLRQHPAKPGCGQALTNDNKAPLSVVKHKTQLCKDCMARADAAAA